MYKIRYFPGRVASRTLRLALLFIKYAAVIKFVTTFFILFFLSDAFEGFNQFYVTKQKPLTY